MHQKIKSYLCSCTLWIVISLGIASLAGWITASSIPTWYSALAKPTFNPPSFVFGPVWTVLYIMIGISGGILWQHRKKAPMAFIAFIAQLICNFSWSFIFFGAHQAGWALVDIVLLISFILLTLYHARQASKVATALLLPYLAWVLFASVLNASIWLLNSL
jgi:benzodiazapine receptor